MMENILRFKNVLIVCFVVLASIGLGVLVIVNQNQEDGKLFLAVQNHVGNYGASIITLNELTDFEWERALYFRVPSASLSDIRDAIGVDVSFDEIIDLVGGMIFVKNEEVVYYEIFADTFLDSSDPRRAFIVSIRTTRVKILEHSDLFEVGGGESGVYWMALRD